MIEKYIERQAEYQRELDKKCPRIKPKRKFPYWILAVIVLAIAIFYFSSCNSQKHIVKEKQSVDSSFVKELLDSVKILTQTKEHLEKTINEMQYAGVSFDTVYLEGKRDTVINTVIVTKEGEIKASGRISSAYVTKTVLINVLKEKNEIIDSFALALEKEKKNVKIDTQVKTVEKEVKTGSFPWMTIAVVLLIGIYAGYKSRNYILKLLN